MVEKFFLKILAVAVLVNCLAVSPVQASIETVAGTGEYIMSMKETPEFAQQNAKIYAERAAIEQAGIFIASVSISKNFQLQDEITTFAVGLLKNIKVVKNEMIPLTGEAAGYIKVVVTVEAQVDTDDFETALKKWQNKDSNEKSNLVEQDKSQQKLIENQTQQIKELEQNLSNIKTEQDKQNIQQKIKEIDKDALYIQKIYEGRKFFNKKNYTEALKFFDEAVNLNPNNYKGYFERGTTYQYIQNYEQSIIDLNKAIELNPNSAAAYNNRGETYRYLKKYNQAISDYNKALNLNLNYDAAYNNRAIVMDDLKQYDAAIADYTKAIECSPNEALYYRNRAYTYDNMKNYDAAIIDLNKAIELDPNSAKSYNNRGWAYKNLKNYSQAISDYTKAIELNPNKYLYYKNRAECYQALGETEKADADFAKARELRKGRELGRL